MEFVDRKDEMARMKWALERPNPSFIVVYGRRRLGKSTLIKRCLTENDVYFLADRTEARHQRHLLAKSIAQKFPDFDKPEYPDWETLFRALNFRTQSRFTLCLDELPYIAEQSPDIPSVLQKLLDEKQLKYNLVVCGSSQNMMYGMFLDSTSPLYGRADELMKLSPLRLPYLQEALRLSPENTIEEFSVWGGVPRYWELRESKGTLREALWNNVLSEEATLYEEPGKLFQDDVKDIVKTATIMSYVGTGANRLSEIAARCNEPATNLSRPLKKLIDLGFLCKDVPFGAEEKNSKKSLYRIADPFLDFYYQYVVPNRSFIELGRRLPVQQALDAHFQEYVSFHWEKICRNAVTGNIINGILYGKASRWWGTVLTADGKPVQVEFDVMAESLDKKYLLVGECKWTAKENGAALTEKLLDKARMLPFAGNYIIVPVLFLKNRPDADAGNALIPEDIIRLSF
jgi:uncharacterized protein